MKRGGLDGGFWAIYTPQGPLTVEGFHQARDFALMRGLSIRQMVAAQPGSFALAITSAEAGPIAAAGKRVVFMSMENPYPLGDDLSLLKTFYAMGVRLVGFAHFAHNQFADSSTDPSGRPRYGGLSPLGKDLLKEMNRLGIVPDASHSSDQVLDDSSHCRPRRCCSVIRGARPSTITRATSTMRTCGRWRRRAGSSRSIPMVRISGR